MITSKIGILRRLFFILAVLAVAASFLLGYVVDNRSASTDGDSSTSHPDIMEQLIEQLKNNSADPNSFAQPDEAKIDHIHLDLKLDFTKTQFTGRVKLNCTKVSKNAKFLTLDSLELNINKVRDAAGKNVAFEVFRPVPEFGSKIEIDISTVVSQHFVLIIDYDTSSKARGLQWLNKEQSQTELPFMFSQFEAINARSFLPCQDTPAIKASYTADIEADSGFTVLMSAKISEDPVSTENGTRIHKFIQKVPIPSYLIAVVAGQIEHRKLGPRSNVWAVPKLIEKAAWEFADLDHILKTAEQLAGPYVFEQYDLLVLPPSFPFGGMENPCLTFVTPTLLAGDRSLVYVAAHEIAHSWTGNLVTNKNFEHFWLNEGFTTFLERKIAAKIGHGEKTRQFNALEGLKGLNDTLQAMGPTNPLTKLVTDLRGINPDDAFSDVPYEKGHTFLFYLEQLLGGPTVFEPFLRSYIQHFKYRSIETQDFKDYFLDYFKNNDSIKKIDWDGWLNTPGAPLHIPQYDETLLKVSIKLATDWIAVTDDVAQNDSEIQTRFPIAEYKALESGQKKLFFIELQERTVNKPLTTVVLDAILKHYSMNDEHNAEVSCQWILLGLKSHYEKVVKEATDFVTEIGRMKFIRPIYRALYAWDAKRQLAVNTFLKNKPNMMANAVAGVEADLHLRPAV